MLNNQKFDFVVYKLSIFDSNNGYFDRYLPCLWLSKRIKLSWILKFYSFGNRKTEDRRSLAAAGWTKRAFNILSWRSANVSLADTKTPLNLAYIIFLATRHGKTTPTVDKEGRLMPGRHNLEKRSFKTWITYDYTSLVLIIYAVLS